MTLAQQFQKQAIAQAQTAMLAHGCPTKRLVETLQTKGGVETVQELCRRGRLSDGFDALQKCGHLEFTLEALVIQGKYGTLFTDEEVNGCLDALMAAGYF